jgi:hypothetical protein
MTPFVPPVDLTELIAHYSARAGDQEAIAYELEDRERCNVGKVLEHLLSIQSADVTHLTTAYEALLDRPPRAQVVPSPRLHARDGAQMPRQTVVDGLLEVLGVLAEIHHLTDAAVPS